MKKTDYYYPEHDNDSASQHNSPGSSEDSDEAKKEQDLKRRSEPSKYKSKNLRSDNKNKNKGIKNTKPRKVLKRNAKGKISKIGIKLKEAISEAEEDTSDCDIPDNLQDLFSVFHQFVQDTHNESSDEIEEQNQQHYHQEFMQMDPNTQKLLELHSFCQSLETEDERRI